MSSPLPSPRGRQPIPKASRTDDKRKLTGKQRAFVERYISNGLRNSSDAYRAAYPVSHKWTPQAVATEAGRLLVHPSVFPIITEAKRRAAERVEIAVSTYAVSKERIINELAAMAFADPRKLFAWGPDGVVVTASDQLSDMEAAAVVEVSQTRTADGGGTIRVKLGDKQAALMNLARLHEMLRVEMVVKGDKDNPIVIEQRDATRAELIRRLDAMAVPAPLTIEGAVEPSKEPKSK